MTVHRGNVVELDALPQLECVGQAPVGYLPALSQVGRNLEPVGVDTRTALKIHHSIENVGADLIIGDRRGLLVGVQVREVGGNVLLIDTAGPGRPFLFGVGDDLELGTTVATTRVGSTAGGKQC